MAQGGATISYSNEALFFFICPPKWPLGSTKVHLFNMALFEHLLLFIWQSSNGLEQVDSITENDDCIDSSSAPISNQRFDPLRHVTFFPVSNETRST